MARITHLLIGVAALASLARPALAETIPPSECNESGCTIRLTPTQLLAKAEFLVSNRRFAEAAPMIAALENAPQFAMERRFLAGYSAAETGNLDGAVKEFRAILSDHPEQTRVRLELARALTQQGKTGGADYHYRLAQADEALPADVIATIRTARGILRNQRKWSLNVDFGFAPDSNISNGTSAQSIDVTFGDQTVPITLDPNSTARSGTGQTLGLSGGLRFKLGQKAAFLIDGDSQIVNYSGTRYDDVAVQMAAGPEFRLSENTAVTVQAVGAQRWYGGRNASLSGGIKAGIAHVISNTDRIGLTIDARRTESGFSSAYSGWQVGAYATYERVIAKSMIASASLFVRRDALNAGTNAGHEIGLNLGVGGELPLGITAGVSGGVSRAQYDAPMMIFSTEPRKDWRMNARVNVGLRSIRVFGFSPSITYTFAQNASSLAFYDSNRHRVRFALARYF
jgi:outer membrane protein